MEPPAIRTHVSFLFRGFNPSFWTVDGSEIRKTHQLRLVVKIQLFTTGFINANGGWDPGISERCCSGWSFSTPRSRWYLPGPNRTESLQAAPWQKNPVGGFSSIRSIRKGWEKEIFHDLNFSFCKINVCFLVFFPGGEISTMGVKNQGPRP